MIMANMFPDGRATVSVGDEGGQAHARFSMSPASPRCLHLALQLRLGLQLSGAQFANEGQRGAGAHEECGSE